VNFYLIFVFALNSNAVTVRVHCKFINCKFILGCFLHGSAIMVKCPPAPNEQNIKKDVVLVFGFQISWLTLIFLLQYCEILEYY